MSRHILVSALVLTIFAGCRPAPPAEQNLLGVWQVASIESDSGRNDNPEPSLVIFTPSYYSLVWIPATDSMREFEERWTPSEDEMIRRYGEIIVNSGRYTRSGRTLTLNPVVSRVPEFMQGGTQIYEYEVGADTLRLTSLDEYSYDGVQAPWAAAGQRVTLTLMRLEQPAH